MAVQIKYNPEKQHSKTNEVMDALGLVFPLSSIAKLNDYGTEYPIFVEIVERLDIDGDGEQFVDLDENISNNLKDALDLFLKSDFYLEIEVQGPSSKQDFQLKLYETKHGYVSQEDNKVVLFSYDINNPIKTSQCSYKNYGDLYETIKKMLESFENLSPTLVIHANDKLLSKGDTLISPLDDYFNIDLSHSTDIDTPYESFVFSTIQTDTSASPNPAADMKLSMNSNPKGDTIKLKSPKNGLYRLDFSLSDGFVTIYKHIFIKIIDRPVLLITPNRYTKYEKISAFQWLKRKFRRNINEKISIELDNYDENKWKLQADSLLIWSDKEASVQKISELPVVANKDSTKYNVHIKFNELGRSRALRYYFTGEVDGVKSKPSSYLVKRPYLITFEDINIGILSIFMPLSTKNNVKEIFPVFPLSFSVHTPLVYFPGHDNYISLGIKYDMLFLDKKSKSRFKYGAVTFSLRAIGTLSKNVQLYIQADYVNSFDNITKETMHFVALNIPVAMKLRNKWGAISFDFLKITYSFKPSTLLWQSGIGIDLFEIAKRGQAPLIYDELRFSKKNRKG